MERGIYKQSFIELVHHPAAKEIDTDAIRIPDMISKYLELRWI